MLGRLNRWVSTPLSSISSFLTLCLFPMLRRNQLPNLPSLPSTPCTYATYVIYPALVSFRRRLFVSYRIRLF
ncbi:hypothetical protein F5880DRAFT_1513755 [Lentinula raphanica]|nr:hypothetical protein F5880DRAFT_1513755 [Lentinula raphanica]